MTQLIILFVEEKTTFGSGECTASRPDLCKPNNLANNITEVITVKMKAALWYGEKDIRVETVDQPVPGRGEVKISVKACGICGTDLHEYVSGPHVIPVSEPHPLTGSKAPVIMGHEFAGRL